MRDVGKRLLTVLRLIQLLLRQKIDRLSRCLHATVFDGYASACRVTRLSIMHRSSVSLSVCPVGQYTQNKCTHIVIVTHRGAAPTRPAYVSALRPECRYTCYAPRSRGGGALSDTAMRPFVSPFTHLSVLGYRHAGCLQLSHHRCADCGPVRGRT